MARDPKHEKQYAWREKRIKQGFVNINIWIPKEQRREFLRLAEDRRDEHLERDR